MKLEAVLKASPYVVSYNFEVSIGGSRPGINSSDLYIELKPRGERPPIGEVIQELRRQAGTIPGLSVFLNPAQNLSGQDRVKGGERSAETQERDEQGQFAGREDEGSSAEGGSSGGRPKTSRSVRARAKVSTNTRCRPAISTSSTALLHWSTRKFVSCHCFRTYRRICRSGVRRRS